MPAGVGGGPDCYWGAARRRVTLIASSAFNCCVSYKSGLCYNILPQYSRARRTQNPTTMEIISSGMGKPPQRVSAVMKGARRMVSYLA